VGRVRQLDTRDLAMPGPLLAVLAALETLRGGDSLRVLVARDPVLLYPLLRENGFDWSRRQCDAAGCTVLIWRTGDTEAERSARGDAGHP